MIEGVTKNIAVLSLLGLIYTATFNVGYFAAVGVHFIGVMDASNFVNSFAFMLMFFMVTALLMLLGANLLHRRKDIWGASKLYAVMSGISAVASAAAYVSFKGYSLAVVLVLVSYTLALCAGASPIYGYWAKTRHLKMQWLLVLFIISLFGMVGVGRAFGEQQKLLNRHYTFATKSGNIIGAAMLRAASSGFLIAVDGEVQFIASSEVKSVTEERPSR
jgi:hypothetical protein